MKNNKPTVEDYISAILDRNRGISYPDVLVKYNITPTQFYRAVTRELSDFVRITSGKKRQILQQINSEQDKITKLFDMGEEFVNEQYDSIQQGRQSKFYEGTFRHPRNIESVVYHALTNKTQELSSQDRAEVISAIKSLLTTLSNYLYNIGLGGLMMHAFPKEERGSPLAVLKLFDRVYQQKTGDKSLFDLSEELHLHEWGDKFHAPHSYWAKQINVETAVYHTLSENNPQLKSQDRVDVISAIKSLPINLADYLHGIGLGGLMMNAFPKGEIGSPLAVLKVFDRAYQQKTGDNSLFDKTQQSYLDYYKSNILIR